MLTRESPEDRPIVLLVEPDPDTRHMYVEYFRRRALRPIAVATGDWALTLASRVNIIVTGLLLPGHVDGIGLIERLKSDATTRNVPVIVVTSCAWTTERVRAEQAGCDLFLTKPCEPEHLTREVHRLLTTAPGRRTA
jgi:DNA-binding response OmpR family regulator